MGKLRKEEIEYGGSHPRLQDDIFRGLFKFTQIELRSQIVQKKCKNVSFYKPAL